MARDLPTSASPGKSELPLRSAIFSTSEEDAQELKALLTAHPSIDVTSLAHSTSDIEWALNRLLFCDLDGIERDIFPRLSERPTSMDVILLASDNRWAADAFEIDALDFLVKPVTKERLGRTIRRLLRLDWATGPEFSSHPKQIFVPFERGRRLIAVGEICAIHAVGNYTQVLLAGGATEIVLRPLRRWEETMPPDFFVRLHRSTLAATGRIRKIELAANGDGALAELEGLDQKLPVSRRCLGAVRAVLGTARP
jgi:two-component system LytT family response regulator